MTDDGNMRARYRRILRFAARYLVQTWWYELFLPRIGLARLSARNRSARLQRIAQRFHVLAVDLGGLMIKVGQFMSSRLDVLPPEITKELEGLQDEVPAVPFPAIRALAESELGVTLERAFSFVDPTPLAAASLGQVHRARLSEMDAAETGLLDVVVKIQRPGIGAIVDVDLRALRRVAGWLSHIRLVSDRVDMPVLVEEFAVTSLEEIDYLHEAASAERFAGNFADDARVSVPELVWERTTRRVLTLQDVTAIKINDVDGLRAAGIDPAEVATEFAAVMFDQLFVNGYFHADPHPGNIFVTPLATADAATTADAPGRAWKFTFIDFGMMGEVPDALRRGLRNLLIAAASRNGKGMVDGIREVGVLLPSADTAELERALTALFARFGGMGFAELQEVDPREFRAFANEFGDVVRTLPVQLPENFLLIVRAMSLTSGMCSSLDPAFNIWNAVEPYSAQLIRAEGGNLVQDLAKRTVAAAGLIARLPQRLDTLITRVEDGNLTVQTPRLERRLGSLERTGRRIISAVLFTALLIGGILLRADDVVFGTVLMAVSVLPLLHATLAGAVARRGPLP
ncbi:MULTISPECIES: AarF/ABC1/UbiB kinase family protein [unclassified Cryobacterium]|uniref:ABC1 kinase family protein n=1 Tax=unclassified Cryobacterium TaxID=2649013 RepID=UPI00106C3C3F|nr:MULTISPECIES: AarF/UbiB family protein [unclassified Cryobacterium]MEB0003117.1 AarF/UbiB family protein [Cryobacterium sp. RTC2.1]MEB0286882.1 AarF/UbiB family protein [Cryobacterium sp. 10S3]MEB0304906.1 AarF/UbiB family protein [Cryobacterium sp. 10I1]TFB95837.1 AarF/ABC1/UbiB kinase family protein [Cryobacterium sp. MDB2-A-1]TFC02602.1 AarF/ABC1/UbiB kinase family protein [Cryobacterium sp. MDB2-33-2]